MGSWWGGVHIELGFFRDNGKENGNYYLLIGFRVQGSALVTPTPRKLRPGTAFNYL